MIKNIRELLNYYNINIDVPDYVLEYEFPEEVENYGEHSTEKHEGKTVHVFTTTDTVDNKEIKIENILDLNNPYVWTEIRYIGNNNPISYQTIIEEERILETDD